MTKPLFSFVALLLLPVVTTATIRELRADPARTTIEEIAIAPVGGRVAEIEEAGRMAASRLDALTDHHPVDRDALAALVTTLLALDHRLDTVAADAAELRYWTRQTVEREQMPNRAWRGGLAERDARRLQAAVRARLAQFDANETAIAQLRGRLDRLITAATAPAADPPAAAETTP